MKTAYKFTAEIPGKSWTKKSTVLTALNDDDAILKAKKALNLTDEHMILMEPVRVGNMADKLTADSYPYGRLRTTAFFSVEYVKGKGMRSIFQTIDPKTGRHNKEKKSTYYQVVLPMIEKNGHIHFCGYLDFNGAEEINKGLQFMADFYDCFDREVIKDIAITILAMCKVDIKARVIYSGSNFDNLKPLFDNPIKKLVEIANTGENLFEGCFLDIEKINAERVEGYNPFTVKTYTVS